MLESCKQLVHIVSIDSRIKNWEIPRAWGIDPVDGTKSLGSRMKSRGKYQESFAWNLFA